MSSAHSGLCGMSEIEIYLYVYRSVSIRFIVITVYYFLAVLVILSKLHFLDIC